MNNLVLDLLLRALGGENAAPAVPPAVPPADPNKISIPSTDQQPPAIVDQALPRDASPLDFLLHGLTPSLLRGEAPGTIPSPSAIERPTVPQSIDNSLAPQITPQTPPAVAKPAPAPTPVRTAAPAPVPASTAPIGDIINRQPTPEEVAQTDPDFVPRLQGWLGYLQNPQVQAMLLQFSASILNRRGSFGNVLGNSLIDSLQASGRFAAGRDARTAAARAQRIEDQKLNLQERTVAARELTAQAAATRAARGGGTGGKTEDKTTGLSFEEIKKGWADVLDLTGLTPVEQDAILEAAATADQDGAMHSDNLKLIGRTPEWVIDQYTQGNRELVLGAIVRGKIGRQIDLTPSEDIAENNQNTDVDAVFDEVNSLANEEGGLTAAAIRAIGEISGMTAEEADAFMSRVQAENQDLYNMILRMQGQP